MSGRRCKSCGGACDVPRAAHCRACQSCPGCKGPRYRGSVRCRACYNALRGRRAAESAAKLAEMKRERKRRSLDGVLEAQKDILPGVRL